MKYWPEEASAASNGIHEGQLSWLNWQGEVNKRKTLQVENFEKFESNWTASNPLCSAIIFSSILIFSQSSSSLELSYYNEVYLILL